MLPIVSLLIYWLFLFGACYALTEFAQNYFYEETTPHLFGKIAGGSLLLALMLTWTRTRFDTMFTTDLGQTVLQAILWFAVFTLVLRFHPWHAAALGIGAMVIVTGIATMAVESLTVNRASAVAQGVRPPTKPVRQPSGGRPRPAVEEAGKAAASK